MDLTRKIASSFAFLLCLISAPALESRADATAVPGSTCFRSEQAINSNLPLGSESTESEIKRIDGIFLSNHEDLVGWLYTTRNNSQFIQARSPGLLANAFGKQGARRLALDLARAPANTYLAVPAGSAITSSSESIVLASCKDAH
jgi:hypothetical protein